MANFSFSTSSSKSSVVSDSRDGSGRSPAKTSYLVNIPLGANIFLDSSDPKSPFQRIKAIVETNPFFKLPTERGTGYDIHVVIGVNQPDAKTPADLKGWMASLSDSQRDIFTRDFPEAGKPDPFGKLEIERQLSSIDPEFSRVNSALRDLAGSATQLKAQLKAQSYLIKEPSELSPVKEPLSPIQLELNQVLLEMGKLGKQQKQLDSKIRALGDSRRQAIAAIRIMESDIKKSMHDLAVENLDKLRADLVGAFSAPPTSSEPIAGTSTPEASPVDVAATSRVTNIYVEQFFWDKHEGNVDYPAIRNSLIDLGRNQSIVEQLTREAGSSKDIIYVSLDPDTALDRSQLGLMENELKGDVPASGLVVGHYTLQLPSTSLLQESGRLDWSHFLVAKNAIYDKLLKEALATKEDRLVLGKYKDKDFEEIKAMSPEERTELVLSNCAALKTRLLDVELVKPMRDSIEALLDLYNSSTWEPPDSRVEADFNALLRSINPVRSMRMLDSSLMTPLEKSLSTITEPISWDRVLYPPEPALAFLLFKKSKAEDLEAPLDFFAKIRGEKIWGANGAASEGQELTKKIDAIWGEVAQERGIAPPRSVSFALEYKTDVPARFLDHTDDRLPKNIDDLVDVMDSAKGRGDIREALAKIHGEINQSSIHTQFLTKRLAFLDKRFSGVELRGKPLLEAAKESFMAAYKHQLDILFSTLIDDCFIEIKKLVQIAKTKKTAE